MNIVYPGFPGGSIGGCSDIVEVHQDPRVFHVELEKLLEWLDRGRRGSRDNPRKQWLRRLLDASIWGPPTAEEEARAARGQSV